MGYRIEYGSVKKVRYAEKRRSRLAALTGLFFLLFLFLTVSFWSEGRQLLQKLVFPGDWAVTTAALETLSSELGEGQSLSDALAHFCRSILEGSTAGVY